MPKYEYPAHIYSKPTDRQREPGEFDEQSEESSSSEDDTADFFSNQDFLKSRESRLRKRAKQWTAYETTKKHQLQYKSGVGQLSEGRAYIEGGRQYQQRKDSYDDLIDELLFDDQPE